MLNHSNSELKFTEWQMFKYIECTQNVCKPCPPLVFYETWLILLVQKYFKLQLTLR